MIYISSALAGEPVGLLETDDGGWSDSGVSAHIEVLAAAACRTALTCWQLQADRDRELPFALPMDYRVR
jgi:hypothetical protein